MRRLAWILAPALALAACADDSTLSETEPQTERAALVVGAPAALEPALRMCAPDFAPADVTLRFAGADALAAQVREKAIDVIAVAGRGRLEPLAGALEPALAFASDERATYLAAAARASRQPDAAQALVDDLLAGACHEALLAEGFGEP